MNLLWWRDNQMETSARSEEKKNEKSEWQLQNDVSGYWKAVRGRARHSNKHRNKENKRKF